MKIHSSTVKLYDCLINDHTLTKISWLYGEISWLRGVLLLNHHPYFFLIQDKQQRDVEIDKIIKYHLLLIDLHEKAEKVMNRPMLVQLLFLMIGVGTPSLRFFLVNLKSRKNNEIWGHGT